MATTLFTVPQATRGPGALDTGNHAVAGVQQNTFYRCTFLMNTADIADTTLTIGMQLWLDAQIVRDDAWTCGVRDRHGNLVAPNLGYATGATVPTTVRLVVTLPRALSVGLTLTAEPVVQ